MSTLILAPAISGVQIATLADQIDKLAELRAAKKQMEQDERAMTVTVLGAMGKLGLPAFRASHAVATVGERTTLTVDPELFLVAAPRAYDAMTVSVERARRFLGDSELSAISERSTVPTLRVELIARGSL